MSILPNVNLPLPLPTTLLAIWNDPSNPTILQQDLTWLFSSLDTVIAAVPPHYTNSSAVWVAPLLDSSNWLFLMGPDQPRP